MCSSKLYTDSLFISTQQANEKWLNLFLGKNFFSSCFQLEEFTIKNSLVYQTLGEDIELCCVGNKYSFEFGKSTKNLISE